MQINSKGFTLIELVVVVIIMGTVALLVMTKMNSATDSIIQLAPSTLKNYLASFEATSRIDLMCYESCSKCDVWIDEKKIKSSIKMNDGSRLKVVHLDAFGDVVESDHKWIARDGVNTEVCFVLSLYPDGHTSSLILQKNDRFYLYRPLPSKNPIILRTQKELIDTLYPKDLLPLNKDAYHENR
ncbi:MAG: hypothetical protein B7Y17_02235 [Sulfuricurvum sp. 24-42-5]|nr:MAG: hypothetical protein B7Y17_02235 [Sulfuricurvum sp. 24-42-5]